MQAISLLIIRAETSYSTVKNYLYGKVPSFVITLQNWRNDQRVN